MRRSRWNPDTNLYKHRSRWPVRRSLPVDHHWQVPDWKQYERAVRHSDILHRKPRPHRTSNECYHHGNKHNPPHKRLMTLLGTSKHIYLIQESFTLPCIPFLPLSFLQSVDRGFVQIEVQIQKPTSKRKSPSFFIYITAALGLPFHKPVETIFWSVKIPNPLVTDTLV